MGKATFVRYVAVLPVRYVVVALPCAGGVLFLLGSFCFWPGSGEAATTVGAACFLVGSLCYWAAPFLDFWELTHNLDNLVDRPLVMPEAVSSAAHARMSFHAALYEQLYKAHLLRLQRANSIIFMTGGAFFVAGSSLFFPAMEELIMHGGWLYITGCVLVLLAALLGALTAAEMQQTAAIRSGWSDEEATLLSCGFYVVGNLAFIVGSVLFFPRILEAGGPPVRMSAVLLFVAGAPRSLCSPATALRAATLSNPPRNIPTVGSLVFLAGALIDLLVVMRAAAAERRRSAPLEQASASGHAPRAEPGAGKGQPQRQRPAPLLDPEEVRSNEDEREVQLRDMGGAAACRV